MENEEDILENLKGQLRNLKNNSDIEIAHSDADDILCNLLILLGYSEIVELYEEVPKWYA